MLCKETEDREDFHQRENGIGSGVDLLCFVPDPPCTHTSFLMLQTPPGWPLKDNPPLMAMDWRCRRGNSSRVATVGSACSGALLDPVPFHGLPAHGRRAGGMVRYVHVVSMPAFCVGPADKCRESCRGAAEGAKAAVREYIHATPAEP